MLKYISHCRMFDVFLQSDDNSPFLCLVMVNVVGWKAENVGEEIFNDTVWGIEGPGRMII